MVATGQAPVGVTVLLIGQTDGGNPPTTNVSRITAQPGEWRTITTPVARGQFYRALTTAAMDNPSMFFVPLGTVTG
jgi:hypothetical protein